LRGNLGADGSGEPETGLPGVAAAFDFDGTLSRSDTLWPFLRRLCGVRPLAGFAAQEAAPIMRVLAGRGDRDALKAAMIARLLTGRSVDEAKRLGARYGDMVVASRLRAGATELVHWHRRRGHRTILVSAGLELYLGRVGELLGFDDVIATRLEEQDGRLTGRLSGANVLGAEKARRLHQLLGGGGVRLFAYGNGAGDREMLAMADRPLLVPRCTRLRPPASD
jgi:phosphatidylglycerophosphatase C